MFTRTRLLVASALLALVAACSAPPPPPPPTQVVIHANSITCQVGTPCTEQITGSGGVLATYAWSASGNPGFLSFTASGATYTFSGDAAFLDYSSSPTHSYNFTVSLTDGSTSASQQITVTLTPPNGISSPTIQGSPPTTATAGSAYAFTPTVVDGTSTPLTFSLSNAPGWLNVDANTGALSGTPQATDIGTDSNIVLTVTDGYGLSAALPAFTITVSAAVVVPPPPITGGSGGAPTTAAVGQAYSFTPSLNDPAHRVWTFVAGSLPVWANFNPTTGTISGTPLYAFLGQTTTVSITAQSGSLTTAAFVYTVQVTAPVPGYLPSAPTPNGPTGAPALPAIIMAPGVLNGITTTGSWTLFASESVSVGGGGQFAFSDEFNLVSAVANPTPTQVSCASAIGCLTLNFTQFGTGTPNFTSVAFVGTGSFAGNQTCTVNGQASSEPSTLTAAVSPQAPSVSQLLACYTGQIQANQPNGTGVWQIAYSVSPYNTNFVDLSIIATNFNGLLQQLQVLTLDYTVDNQGNAALIGSSQINSNGGGTLQFLHN